MYCPKCGNQIHDEAVICVHCGCENKSMNRANGEYRRMIRFSKDALAINLISVFALVFIIPIVTVPISLILLLVRSMLLRKYEDVDKQGNKFYLAPKFKLTDRNHLLEYKTALKRLDVGIKMGDAIKYFSIIFGSVVVVVLVTLLIIDWKVHITF